MRAVCWVYRENSTCRPVESTTFKVAKTASAFLLFLWNWQTSRPVWSILAKHSTAYHGPTMTRIHAKRIWWPNGTPAARWLSSRTDDWSTGFCPAGKREDWWNRGGCSAVIQLRFAGHLQCLILSFRIRFVKLDLRFLILLMIFLWFKGFEALKVFKSKFIAVRRKS